MDTGEQLCLACGMCCDGSLFDNVQLEKGEDRETVKSLGLPVKLSRAKAPIAFFRQPCRMLCDDLTCKVYTNRPNQCRSFECDVFKKMQAGSLPMESALRLVKQGKRKAERIRKLLRKMGCTDEKSSIGMRFRRMQRRVESGDVDYEMAEHFSELGLAVHQFDLLAHKKFYTEAEL